MIVDRKKLIGRGDSLEVGAGSNTAWGSSAIFRLLAEVLAIETVVRCSCPRRIRNIIQVSDRVADMKKGHGSINS